MKTTLKRLFFIVAALCIPAGFFTEHEHVVFFWHKIPSIETVFGFLGAYLLIGFTRILASFAHKREDFYD